MLLQWPARIDLSLKSLSPALHPQVTASGKLGRARRGRLLHQLSARRTICTTDCTQLFRNVGRYILVLSLARMPTIYVNNFREMLGNLETSVNSLEQGSKNMLAQAKLLAAKQTAKSWMPKF
jgi:hypothetical protein